VCAQEGNRPFAPFLQQERGQGLTRVVVVVVVVVVLVVVVVVVVVAAAAAV